MISIQLIRKSILSLFSLSFALSGLAQSNNCSGIPSLAVNTTCSNTAFSVTQNGTGNEEINASCATSGTAYSDGWYTVTGTGNTITVTASSTDRAAVLAAFTACGGGTELDCDIQASGTNCSISFSSTLGTTYYIQIQRRGGNSNADLSGNICAVSAASAPGNDNCANATSLPCGTTNLAGTTNGTVSETPGVGCSLSGFGVWYTFVGDGNVSTITLNPASGFDPELAIATGTCASKTSVACKDDGGSGSAESASFATVNGQTYYVYVAYYGTSGTASNTGNFTISRSCSAPLTNDNCSGATAFPAIPTDGTCATLSNQSNVGAAASGVTPTGACTSNSGTPDDDVWFSFVATSTIAYLEATYISGTTDVYWQVFSSSCASSMTAILCTDANAGGTMTGLTIGNTYYVRLYTYSSGTAGTVQNICIHGPIPGGAGCVGATTISSLPYSQNNFNTAGSGDDFSSSDVCGSSYMNGDDFVFEYTPAVDECVSITLSNTGSYTGVFVTDLCPDDALANCVDYATSSSGNPAISNVNLTGGTTYYITVSTYPSPQTTVFDIDIENVTCPIPATNDDCVDAIPFPTIPVGGGCAQLLNQSNFNATNSFVTPNGACSSNSGTPDDDVWFSFVATEAILYLEATYVSGTSDVYWQVFSSSCGSNMTAILCTDVNTGGTMTGLTIGNTYYVRMYCYSSGVSATYQDICIHGEPAPVPGQDCSQPLLLCNPTMTIGNPGYSGTGVTDDFDGSGNCTGGEKNSMWLQINIGSSGNLNFDIIPNDADVTSEGPETDYDFVLWKMSGSGSTDCSTILSSGGDNEAACNYNSMGVTGVAPGGNAPAGFDPAFDAAYEPTVSASAGDVFYLVIQNFSGSTQGFTVDFSSSGAGVVDYTPPTTIFWTGGTDADWTDHVNWGNCSVSPVCGVNAIVTGTVTNQPLIPSGDIRYVEDLTINPNATLTLQNNAILHVCGDFTNYGNIVFGNNSTIIFDGGSNIQNIYGNCTGINDFGNFVITKTGGQVILNCDIEIHRDFTTSNATSILNTNGFNVTVGRHFSNFGGDATYTNSGTTGTLTFDGTFGVNQNYYEGISQLNLNHVVVNNAAGQHINLLTNMYVKPTSGTLALTTGQIITGLLEVYVQNDAPTSVSGHSAASFVNGNLRRNIQSLGSYDFPVGNTSKVYQNANVDFTQATSINNLLARFDLYPSGTPTQGGTECSTTYNLPNEDNGYWTITADANSSTGVYDITLYPTNATNTAPASGWTVTKKANIATGTWGLNGTCAASSTASVVLRYDLQGFSVFGVAQATVPLPVELLSFSGTKEEFVNHLYWETAAEINNEKFEVYRSENGYDFYKIGEVEGAGTSTTMKYYDFIDENPGMNEFYRIATVDFNKSIEYSKVIRLIRTNPFNNFTIIPNPSSGLFNISLDAEDDAELDLRVYDYTGRLVLNNRMIVSNGNNRINFDLSNFADGIYSVMILKDQQEILHQVKVVKQ